MSPMVLRMTKEGLDFLQDIGGLEVVMEESGKAFMEKRFADYNDE